MFASGQNVDWLVLLITLVATSLVIASGCVFNNYLDRAIDAKMARTQKRALVTGEIKPTHALIFGSILGLIGFGLLAAYTNWVTILVGAIGIIDYVIIYGWTKRRSPAGTLVGSICGATSIVAGYTAASGYLDVAAVILFAIMAVWQMPHFYAISIYRLKEYKAAGIPVLSVVKGVAATKQRIIGYLLIFIVGSTALWWLGYATLIYGIIMGVAGLWWFFVAWHGRRAKDSDRWAKKVFGSSLLVLMVFSLCLVLNPWLP